MDENRKHSEGFFIDTKPSKVKRELDDEDKSDHKSKRHRRITDDLEALPTKDIRYPEITKQIKKEDAHSDFIIKASIVYYENILKDLKKGVDTEMKEEVICNTLEESEGKEIELACHSLVSHCLELLLTQCKETSIILRFMSAFSKDKVTVCTSANASHLTELLMHHAVRILQNCSLIMNSGENEDQAVIIFTMNWLLDFASFILEYLDDCLHSQYSCHVACTLIGALAGDLAGNKALMSRNLKKHKREFQSQFFEMESLKNNEKMDSLILEQIPKEFSDMLKRFYKELVHSENILDYVSDSSSATVFEALIFALKKRHPKACKKMISKLAKRMFERKENNNIPVCLLHRNTSFIFDEMFKAADEDLQLQLWHNHIADNIEKLIIDPVGNFVVQRIFDAINDRTLFEIACKQIWPTFSKINETQNYGVFVSIAVACNRLGTQQSFFMENIMKCLNCYDPLERQDSVIPLLLGFQNYDNYATKKSLRICLQGSLVVQAIFKFHKPIKAVKSILSMSPEDIEFLSGHMQGCHVLNAFFGSVTVGEKNKEKLLIHMQPVLLPMACDRNKSLTLSRVWTCLSLKLKEIIARQLAQNQETLKSTKSGYAVFQKFSIPRFRKLEEWKQMQSNICNNKKKIKT